MAVALAQRPSTTAAPLRRTVTAAPPSRSVTSSAPAFLPTTTPALGLASGEPLQAPIRRSIESSFGRNLESVRVHSGSRAGAAADQLGAKAFAFGPNIVLGSRARPDDLGVMAHEAAHTIQQGAGSTLQTFSLGAGDSHESEAHQASQAALRGERFAVMGRTSGMQVQGLFDLPNPLDWIAGKANLIPGFRMFTIILGVNPINMSSVDRSAANILRAMIEFLPGGGLITQALDNAGVFEKAGAFVEKQIATLRMTGSAIKSAVTSFISETKLTELVTNPGGIWERAKRIFTEPIDRIKAFGVGLVVGIIEIIKDAILKPIAKLAEGTEGYNLLKGVLGKDPITDEDVPRSAETLLGPLLKMIGLGDLWQKMQDAKAIPRCWAWFQSTMGQLLAIVTAIPPSFIAAFKSLTLEDIILVPNAFIKLGKVFVGFVAKFVTWGVDAMWELLKIVFDVVSPGAWGHIQKTGAALQSILKNPLPFVGNLVKAAKLGFENFAGHFGAHLKAGLLDWLTGSLPGIYIPKSFALSEIVKFVLSVLGLSWANVRQKLVKAVGETAVKAMETGFDIVVTLVRDGPAAAWDKIKEHLSNLKEMVIEGIISMVVEMIVTKAVPKLIAMFIPGAGFISAIISIYDTVMVFVRKISQIIQVVNGFISSIVAIAAGNIGAAAGKVESVLAGLLSLAINFLAGFAGLGKAATKVMDVVQKIRAPIDKALDALINWIVTMAKRLGRFIAQAGVPQDPNERLRLASRASLAIVSRLPRTGLTAPIIAAAHEAIKLRYGLTELTPYQQGGAWFIRAVVNPPLVWRLPLPGETAGTGGIRSVAMQTGPGGAITTGVRGELGPGIPRQGFEANLPNAGNLPSLAGSYLQGYRRAHLYGPGFGDETAIGLMYASEQVNNELQSHGRVYGIEGYARQIRERVTALGGRVAVQVVATSFRDPPPGVPQALNQPVLRSVTYTFVVVNAQGNELRYRGPRAIATITCAPPRANGAGGQGAVDYRHLMELNEYLGSRSQATGL